jgi:hypothetical protein
MSHSRPATVDLTTVSDPDVRRALRAIHQEMREALSQQQLEIDALLEMVMEKNHASLSEFKRHMVRLMQNEARGDRIHEMILAAAATPRPGKAPNPGSKTDLH